MSIRPMSFNETDGKNGRPHWRDCIGFTVRIGLSYRKSDNAIVVEKGSLVYGFKDEGSLSYGFVVDSEEVFFIPLNDGVYYIVMDRLTGGIQCIPGSFAGVHGLGANVSGIPWYTYEGKALIGKVFQFGDISTVFFSCDDAYRCEYEHSFGG